MNAARRAFASELGRALIKASQDNMIIDICRLLTLGADVNYVLRYAREGEERSTMPLLEAVLYGHADAVRVLISRGADVNKQQQGTGRTVLHAAARYDLVPVIELLISKGARHDLRSKDGQTPLHMATLHKNKKAASSLLAHGADANAKTGAGSSSLLLAAQYGHIPLVDLLIVHGADLNLADNQGVTPLMQAAHNGHAEIVQLLVEKGAVLDQTTTCHGLTSTALGLASCTGHLEIIDYLLSAGANIGHIDSRGASPLHAAAEEGNLDVIKLLLKKGADINHTSIQGLTPLHVAALSSHEEVVDYLIRKGSKFEARGTIAKSCKCCGATDVHLKLCTGCGVVCYCSPECQTKDWKEGGENSHKIQCKKLVEMRERYVEKAKKEIGDQMARFGVA